MKNQFDQDIDNLIYGDELMGHYRMGGKNIYLIEEAWTMLEDPWRIQWIDPRTQDLCEIAPVGSPLGGQGKYTMFVVWNKEEGEVKNYVFILDQYHYSGDHNEVTLD